MSDVECGISRMENSMLPALHAHELLSCRCWRFSLIYLFNLRLCRMAAFALCEFHVRNLKWSELKFNQIICEEKKKKKPRRTHSLHVCVWNSCELWIHFIFLLLLKALLSWLRRLFVWAVGRIPTSNSTERKHHHQFIIATHYYYQRGERNRQIKPSPITFYLVQCPGISTVVIKRQIATEPRKKK